ncbi:ABC transporter substrate-binding protein [Crateriforma spongiae]|uniref:ABC transporter substrate-binding protein n=1 Tax=Crateriforma spongiae TaxID=2724528 RepID=UPI001444F42B|nr:ABC transporter substrate-binding protein [Crateriforma spongiae]
MNSQCFRFNQTTGNRPRHLRTFIHRVTGLIIASGLLFALGCRQSDQPPTVTAADQARADQLAVQVQLNWYPETEHGGVYQAQADGTYAAAGLNVEIRPGGRATPVAPELDLARCHFAITGADDVIQFRRQGSKVVAVLAAVQNHPRCIMVQAACPVRSFDDFATSGMTLQCQPGRAFLDFLEQRGYLKQVKQVPYHGSVASLVTDPTIAIQAYSFAEPLLAKQQGVQTRQLMVSDLGWNPYSSVLVTTETLIEEQPELVRKFVQATRQGWQHYFDNPALGNAAVLDANQHGMTAEALQFGVEQMKPLAVPQDMTSQDIGMMTLDRWQTLVEQMDSLDPQRAGKVRPGDCFTTAFLRDES